MGETWSSSFASAMIDHEQMKDVYSVPEFNIPVNEFPLNSRISSSLRTVAQNMRVSIKKIYLDMKQEHDLIATTDASVFLVKKLSQG
jgi:hypothetical protein